MKQTFYLCRHCGNLAVMLRDCGVRLVCCGEKMHPLQPGTAEGAGEKHIPVYTVAGDTVTVEVGQEPHPMEPAHYIQWICLQSDRGMHYRCLEPEDAPRAVFHLERGEQPEAVYAFCNRHDLWMGDKPAN